MNSESSDKFYYRYIISPTEPLTLSSHARKIQKAKKHSTTHLLVDLVSCKNLAEVHFEILQDSSSFRLQYLICAQDYLKFKQQVQTKDHDIFIFIAHQIDSENYQALKTELKILASPLTNGDLKYLLQTYKNHDSFFWSFRPYNSKIKKGLTLKEIYQTRVKYKKLNGLEILNTEIPEHYELESQAPIAWQFQTETPNLQLSVVIPSFNNVTFLSNVLQHLIKQTLPKTQYEIIVVEDGGQDRSCEMIQNLLLSFKDQINLKFIYWSKHHPVRGAQSFFRAGLARNLAMQYIESPWVVFLDSDMLVPHHFIEECLKQLKKSDLIQFQRYHIHQNISLKNPSYHQVNISEDTYIEEKNYWNQLFQSNSWMSLPHYWKFTCTYALGMSVKNYLSVGRFKKYYVSYGFEDTDLGYEFFKRGLKFNLVQIPLLHLTAYDHMQYKNSQIQRLKLLRKTAALFYLQHLDSEIYELFGNFFRFEKKIRHSLRDLF
jgi:glycosyltransferase involved in cell wall biosynthesis